MNVEEKELIRVLAAFIHLEKITFSPEINWEKFYYLAQIHSIVPIVYYKIKESGCEFTKTELVRWSSSGKMVIMQMVQQEYEIAGVIARLNRERILHVMLKGYQLKQYYPVTEFRTRGDVDMLVRMEDRERVDKLLLEMGYEKIHGKGFVWNYQKGMTVIEVHVKLAEGDFWKKVNCEAYFEDAMSHLMDGEQPYTKYLDREYHFLFLMFHLAKHFYSRGAGLRMFLDIAVYLQTFDKEMDWKYIEQELEVLRLNEFTQNVLCACLKWFGVRSRFLKKELTPKLHDELLRYVITGGVYGHQNEDADSWWLRKEIENKRDASDLQVRIGAFLRYLFPGRKMMRSHLPAIEKHGWLLPAAWCIRWYGGIFKRMESSIKHLQSFYGGMDGVKRQVHFLEEIGL